MPTSIDPNALELTRHYALVAGPPALGLIGSVLLWRAATASKEDPGEAQTARLGFLSTGCSFLATLIVVGASSAAPGTPFVPRGSALLVFCVTAVLLACLGLALTLSNTHGRLRWIGVLLSLGSIGLACFWGWGLLSAPA